MKSTKLNSHSVWLSFMYMRLILVYELLDDNKELENKMIGKLKNGL